MLNRLLARLLKELLNSWTKFKNPTPIYIISLIMTNRTEKKKLAYTFIEVNEKIRLVNHKEFKSRPPQIISPQLHFLQLRQW